LSIFIGGAENAGVENAGVENAGVDRRGGNSGVEIAGATKYGKPSEENNLKYQTKYGCRGFHANLTSTCC